MTLADILKDYALLITTITGFLGLVMGYFFGKWDAERKRKWEIDDRVFERHEEVFEIRLKESREFISNLHEGLIVVGEISNSLVKATNYFQMRNILSTYSKEAKTIFLLSSRIAKLRVVISVLDDKELSRLTDKYSDDLYPHFKYLAKTLEDIAKNEHMNIDKVKLWMVAKACLNGENLISQMMKRIDEIAVKVVNK